MAALTKTTRRGWVWWAWAWWIWSCWVSVWAHLLPYLALAWMYFRTVIPVWEKDSDLVRWLTKKVPSRPVSDLDHDLADGVTLCGLLEALVPGTCPRHDLLPTDQPEANLCIASRLASDFLGVTQDLGKVGDGAGGRAVLVQFLRGIRYAALRRQVLGGPPVTPQAVAQTLGSHQVIARGMGLQMGVVGRRARFTLYLSSSLELDLVVEVKNDRNDYCSHRITHRSPSRSTYVAKDNLKGRHNIPLEYELSGCEVRVAWVPLQHARHSLAIIWRGQHVVGSPYSVLVDESQHNSPGRKCQLLRPLQESDAEAEIATPVSTSRRSSLHKDDSSILSYRAKAGALRFVNILRRRVVRRVVHVGDEDVVLQGDESIGRSFQACNAFRKMRTTSLDSLEEGQSSCFLSPSTSTSASRRNSQHADGKVPLLPGIFSCKSQADMLMQQLDCVSHAHKEVMGEEKSLEEREECHQGSPAESVTREKDLNTGIQELTLSSDILTNLTEVKHESKDVLRSSIVDDINSSQNTSNRLVYSENRQDTDNKAKDMLKLHQNKDIYDADENSHDFQEQDVQVRSREVETLQGSIPSISYKETEENTELYVPKVGVENDESGRRKKVTLDSMEEDSSRLLDETPTDIINSCDFIIKYGSKEEALRTVEIASQIMASNLSDVCEPSLSTTDTRSEDLPVEEAMRCVQNGEAASGDVLETLINTQGVNFSVSLTTQEDTYGENKHISELLKDADESEPVAKCFKNEDNFCSYRRRPLLIPEVVIHEESKTPKAESESKSRSKLVESAAMTVKSRAMEESRTTMMDNEAKSRSILAPADLEATSDMDYLQTIDEETEPSSVNDDNRCASELELCEELHEESAQISDLNTKLTGSNVELGKVTYPMESKTGVTGVISDMMVQNKMISDSSIETAKYCMAVNEDELPKIIAEPYGASEDLSCSTENLVMTSKAHLHTTESLPYTTAKIQQTKRDQRQTTEELLLQAAQKLAEHNHMLVQDQDCVVGEASASQKSSKEKDEVMKECLLPRKDEMSVSEVVGDHLVAKVSEDQLQAATDVKYQLEVTLDIKDQLEAGKDVKDQFKALRGQPHKAEFISTDKSLCLGRSPTKKSSNESLGLPHVRRCSLGTNFEINMRDDDISTAFLKASGLCDHSGHMQHDHAANCANSQSSSSQPPSPMSEEVALIASAEVSQTPAASLVIDQTTISERGIDPPSTLELSNPSEFSISREAIQCNTAQTQLLFETTLENRNSKDYYFVPVEMASEEPRDTKGFDRSGTKRTTPGPVARFRSMFETRSLEEISYLQKYETSIKAEDRNGNYENKPSLFPDLRASRSSIKNQTENLGDERKLISDMKPKTSLVPQTMATMTNQNKSGAENVVKATSSKKDVMIPVISPNMDLLSQFRMDSQSEDSRESGDSESITSHKGRVKNLVKFNKLFRSVQPKQLPQRSVSPTLQTLQSRSALIPRTKSLNVKPGMDVLEVDQSVSRLRSVFETSCVSTQRGAPNFLSQRGKQSSLLQGGTPRSFSLSEAQSPLLQREAPGSLSEDGTPSSFSQKRTLSSLSQRETSRSLSQEGAPSYMSQIARQSSSQREPPRSSKTETQSSLSHKLKMFIFESEDRDLLVTDPTLNSAAVVNTDFSTQLKIDSSPAREELHSFEILNAVSPSTQKSSMNNNLLSDRDRNSNLFDEKSGVSDNAKYLVSQIEVHEKQDVEDSTIILDSSGDKTELASDFSDAAVNEFSHYSATMHPGLVLESALLTPGEFQLQKKSQKLVQTLENMEREIEGMQRSVQLLNKHYRDVPPAKVNNSPETAKDPNINLKLFSDDQEHKILHEAEPEPKDVVPRGKVQSLAQRFNSIEVNGSTLKETSNVDTVLVLPENTQSKMVELVCESAEEQVSASVPHSQHGATTSDTKLRELQILSSETHENTLFLPSNINCISENKEQFNTAGKKENTKIRSQKTSFTQFNELLEEMNEVSDQQLGLIMLADELQKQYVEQRREDPCKPAETLQRVTQPGDQLKESLTTVSHLQEESVLPISQSGEVWKELVSLKDNTNRKPITCLKKPENNNNNHYNNRDDGKEVSHQHVQETAVFDESQETAHLDHQAGKSAAPDTLLQLSTLTDKQSHACLISLKESGIPEHFLKDSGIPPLILDESTAYESINNKEFRIVSKLRDETSSFSNQLEKSFLFSEPQGCCNRTSREPLVSSLTDRSAVECGFQRDATVNRLGGKSDIPESDLVYDNQYDTTIINCNDTLVEKVAKDCNSYLYLKDEILEAVAVSDLQSNGQQEPESLSVSFFDKLNESKPQQKLCNTSSNNPEYFSIKKKLNGELDNQAYISNITTLVDYSDEDLVPSYNQKISSVDKLQGLMLKKDAISQGVLREHLIPFSGLTEDEAVSEQRLTQTEHTKIDTSESCTSSLILDASKNNSRDPSTCLILTKLDRPLTSLRTASQGVSEVDSKNTIVSREYGTETKYLQNEPVSSEPRVTTITVPQKIPDWEDPVAFLSDSGKDHTQDTENAYPAVLENKLSMPPSAIHLGVEEQSIEDSDEDYYFFGTEDTQFAAREKVKEHETLHVCSNIEEATTSLTEENPVHLGSVERTLGDSNVIVGDQQKTEAPTQGEPTSWPDENKTGVEATATDLTPSGMDKSEEQASEDSDDDLSFGTEDSGDIFSVPQWYIDEQLAAREQDQNSLEGWEKTTMLDSDELVRKYETQQAFSTTERGSHDAVEQLEARDSKMSVSSRISDPGNVNSVARKRKNLTRTPQNSMDQDSSASQRKKSSILESRELTRRIYEIQHSLQSSEQTEDTNFKQKQQVSHEIKTSRASRVTSTPEPVKSVLETTLETKESTQLSMQENKDIGVNVEQSGPAASQATSGNAGDNTVQDSSCESDSDDDMRVGPIKGSQSLVIPVSPSNKKSPASTSDSDSPQSDSDVPTDEDDIEVPCKTKAKYTKPAGSRTSKLHTIQELSEDEEEGMPVRPPRFRRLSSGRLKFLESMRSPDSPRADQRFPPSGKSDLYFQNKFKNVNGKELNQKMKEENENRDHCTDKLAAMLRQSLSSDNVSSSSEDNYDDDDEVDDKPKIIYGRRSYTGIMCKAATNKDSPVKKQENPKTNEHEAKVGSTTDNTKNLTSAEQWDSRDTQTLQTRSESGTLEQKCFHELKAGEVPSVNTGESKHLESVNINYDSTICMTEESKSQNKNDNEEHESLDKNKLQRHRNPKRTKTENDNHKTVNENNEKHRSPITYEKDKQRSLNEDDSERNKFPNKNLNEKHIRSEKNENEKHTSSVKKENEKCARFSRNRIDISGTPNKHTDDKHNYQRLLEEPTLQKMSFQTRTSLRFLGDVTQAFFPPMETLLTPSSCGPATSGSPAHQESLCADVNDKSLYLITPLGQQSVLTEKAFAPPMEKLLVSEPQAAVGKAEECFMPGHEINGNVEALGSDFAAKDSILRPQEREVCNYIDVKNTKWSNLSVLTPQINSFPGPEVSTCNTISHEKISLALSAEEAPRVKDIHLFNTKMFHGNVNKGNCQGEENMNTIGDEISVDTFLTTENTDNVDMIDNHCKYLTQKEMNTIEFTGSITSDSEIPEIDNIEHKTKLGKIPDLLSSDYIICKDHKATIKSKESSDEGTFEDRHSDESNYNQGVGFIKEHLTFFQSGGLQEQACSLGVIDPEEAVSAKDTSWSSPESEAHNVSAVQLDKRHPQEVIARDAETSSPGRSLSQLQSESSLGSLQTLPPPQSEVEENRRNLSVSEVNEPRWSCDYIEYQRSFASARHLFERGMKESGLVATGSSSQNVDCNLKHRRDNNTSYVASFPTKLEHIVKYSDESTRSSSRKHSESSLSSSPLKEAQPPQQEELCNGVDKMLPEVNMADHGCQTDKELGSFVSPHTHVYLVNKGCQSSLERVNTKTKMELHFPRDKEIQVYQEDFVSPLKRRVSRRSRQYDLLEMPKLKRRIFRRRRGSQVSTRERSVSDAQLFLKEVFPPHSGTLYELNRDQGWSEDSGDNTINSRKFGIANSSSLVACLKDLASDLPSVYPEGQLDPLVHDDFADLDPDDFQHFPQDEVIQTLSGCYRGEFPHVPVSGASGTTSRVVRKDLGDLISLKELRRSSLPEILSLLPTSESPSPEFESPVDISHTSCHQTSSDTTALLPHPQTIITEDSVYAKHSSCESAVLSSDSANFSLEGVVSTDTSGKGHIQTHSQDAVECSQSKSDRVLTDVSTVVEEANIDLSSEDEKEEEEEIQVDDKDYEGDREEAEDKEEKTRGGQGEDRCGCRAYGDGLAWGTILDTNSFIIDTVAADQGEVRVSVEGTSEGLVSGTEVYPVEDSPGVYQVLYRVTTPGHYQVVITWDGQHIPGSPFTCVVG